MPKVEIYTSPLCGYCHMAKKLLKQKQVDFKEINVLANPIKRSQMEKRSQRRTVPQIFINDEHIGGFDDIYGLEKQGKLDALLVSVSSSELN